MIPEKALYWGDNDAHEFWESEEHELLILRNHHESFWTAHRNYGYLFGCRTDAEAAKKTQCGSVTHTEMGATGRQVRP
jgi:hypothetical protein